jgi:hypothetical protein
MAATIMGDLVIDVDEVESFVPGDDVKDHGGWGCHGVGIAVDNRDGAVDIGFNIGNHFACIIGIVRGVVDVPKVIGGNPENGESEWISV